MLFKFFDKFINKNAKYYDHYISLVYNCECAYRFAMRHHFVEASLFTWANSINIKNLIKAQYPEKEFNLLYFTNDSHFEPLQYKEEHLSNKIIKVTGNYKDLKKGAPDYTVNLKFFKRYYSQYSLNSSLQYKLKRFFTKIFVKSIPVKSVRRRLKTKYHV